MSPYGRRSSIARLFEIDSRRCAGAHLLVLSGELDLSSAAALTRSLADALTSSAPRVVVDLRELTFIDVIGLRVLLAAAADPRAVAPRLRIVRGSRAVQRLFQVTATDITLPFGDQPED